MVIGRNEGERLRNCLTSIAAYPCTMVYVDSGSTDNSLDIAREHNCFIVELDLSVGFTAARARNAGFRYLMEKAPDTDFVQFVDGDCMVDEGWLPAASGFLQDNPKAAVVCGRRRELYPDNSVYNLLCDIEWDTPVGNNPILWR